MSTPEEIAFLTETHTLHTAFIQSKTTKDTDYQGYLTAKTAWSAHRTFWRQIREWFQAVAQEGN